MAHTPSTLELDIARLKSQEKSHYPTQLSLLSIFMNSSEFKLVGKRKS